jgi:exodeoxyribonuclease V alpha subunit
MQNTSGSANQLINKTGKLARLDMYGGWGRGVVALDDGESFVIVGEALAGLELSSRYVFSGFIKSTPKWGPQLDVKSVSIDIPATKAALVRHLSKNFKNVGTKTAEKFVDAHVEAGTLEVLRDQIVNNPYSVDFSSVTKRAVSAELKSGVADHIYRDFSTRLAGAPEVRDSVLRLIAKYYFPVCEKDENPVTKAWANFSMNPYAPIRKVDGYGFVSADSVGRAMKVPPHHANRLAALATHIVDEGCSQLGHVYLTLDDISTRMAAYDSSVDPLAAIAAAQELGEPIVNDKGRFYLGYLLAAEIKLARMLAHRVRPTKPILSLAPEILTMKIISAEKAMGIGFALDTSQRAAIEGLLTSTISIHTVTAGPGCGKTAIMEVLVQIICGTHKIAFCAPTGKAAKVLNSRISRIGAKASTIHSLLEPNKDGGFMRNAENPLAVDVIVADETSMDDLVLMASLVDAAPAGCHIILLGDAKQLPSVGPGNVLADMMRIPLDHHRLSKTHRNGGGILEIVNLAGEGRADMVNRADVSFIHGLPAPDDIGITRVLQNYSDCVAMEGGDLSRVGLIIARRKGNAQIPGWNVTYLNEQLRERFNPFGVKIRGASLRIGDRIIIRKNNVLEQGEKPDGTKLLESVVNGDTGFIDSCFMSETDKNAVSHLFIELDDGRTVRYPGSDIDKLSLAYAITVHAAQGSEYSRVLFICVNGSSTFIHRGIVFTAYSRAKNHLTVMADPQALAIILKRDIPNRNSALIERFHEASGIPMGAMAHA